MYVYVLRSRLDERNIYIGATSNLSDRLNKHNAGAVHHTRKFRPWKFDVVVWFESEEKAWKFEKYLKSGSGYSFRKNHF